MPQITGIPLSQRERDDIREWMKLNKVTIADLAKQIGVAKGTLTNALGLTSTLNVEAYENLCVVTGN